MASEALHESGFTRQEDLARMNTTSVRPGSDMKEGVQWVVCPAALAEKVEDNT